MNNEVMAKAVTGIDDNLILEAQQITKRNRLRPVYSICTLAACLVLVFTFFFSLPGRKGTQLLVNGTEISDSPVVISLPAAAYARETTNKVSIPLTLNPKNETSIAVKEGTMEIYSSDSNTYLFTGTQFTVSTPANVYWLVDGSDITKSYTLTLNNGEIVYTLSYDESASSWSICKQ